MRCYRIVLLGALLAVVSVMRAAWTDVTGTYIKNADFTQGGILGWTVSNSGYTVRAGCMEYWNHNSFRVVQLLDNLPSGHYRLSVQGFHRLGGPEAAYRRMQDTGETALAQLFVNEQATLLPSYFAEDFGKKTSSDWATLDGEHYYPNTMESSAEAFSQGAYTTSIEFDATGETTSIGIVYNYFDYDYSNYVRENWCIFSNFKLETTAEVVLAQSLDLQVPKTTLVAGETMQLQATVLPANTSQKSLSWYSTDSHVVSVDATGLVTAVGVGHATVMVQTIDGSELTKTVELTVTVDKNAEWKDVTNIFLTNPYFDGNLGDGWTRDVQAQGNDVNWGAMEVYNGTFNVHQTLKGLPRGTYRLSMQGFYRAGQNVSGYGNHFSLDQLDEAGSGAFQGAYIDYVNNDEHLTAYLYGGNRQKPVASVYSATLDSYVTSSFNTYRSVWDEESGSWYNSYYSFYPNTMEGGAAAFGENKYWNQVEFDAEGDVTVGVANDQYIASNWCMFDNFKLEFKGQVVSVSDVSLTAPKQELLVGETMQMQAVVTPANALQKQLQWSSSDEGVATVSDGGVVKGIAAGTAVITVRTTDGTDIVRSVSVTVVMRSADGASFVINEIMASNVDEFVSPAYNFDGWVELYNTTSQAVSLSGLYLSDDAAQPLKWKIPASISVLPAKGYQVIWFDSNDIAPQNAPFKLDVDGGVLYISDASGRVLQSQAYPAGMERVSYARTTDGGNAWSYAVSPTLGASNSGSSYATQQLAAPVVDEPSQLFSAPLSVHVTIPAGQQLRYTTDGSLPTLQNGAVSTTGTFSVDATASYRFRLFADGKLPSRVTSRSYIYRDRDYTLPVVSVIADDRFINSTEMGVFVKGPNGRPGNGQQDNCNWNMNWERPVNFSYLDANGEMVLNQDVNLEMCGGWSRAWSPRAFKLKGNKELGGNKNLPYAFFQQKPYIRNRTLQIRNGGNDYYCRFKDPALQYIAQSANLNLDCQSYQPVHEFINGQYMGVLNVREPNNKHYVYANYGWGDDVIDQFEMSPDSGYVQKCGTADAFNDLVTLAADAANTETYEEVRSMLDIDAYANYMAAELYLKNWDWPQNNVKGFRYQDGGRFRFVYFDLDGTFSNNAGLPFDAFMQKETYTFDQLYPTYLGRITDDIRFVTLFKNLLSSNDFRRRFVDAYCMMGGSVYEAQRSIDIIDELAERVNPAMQLEWASVNSTANSLKSNLSSRLGGAMNDLINFGRFGVQRDQMLHVTLSSDAPEAQIMVNDMVVPTGRFNGYLFMPAQLKAVVPAGYAFLGWKSSATSTTTLKEMGTQWSYYDKGSLDGVDWTAPTYDENGWQKGRAPLGYGKDYIVTTLSYGNNAQQKRPTSYFRTTVQLATAPAATDKFVLSFMVDDGAIVYVNGQEAARYNMPSGRVSYSSYATHYAYDNPDQGQLQLPTELFQKGNNVIAVELHNCDNHSTDLVWDASISASVQTQGTQYLSTEQEISLPSERSVVELTACYRALTAAERQSQGVCPVRINEVSGSNDSYINDLGKKADWVELYNTTDAEVDVEGMYLSDKADNPTKYQITKGQTNAQTRIPAHGYLLVWCDKQPTTSQALHASFKVDGDGGMLQLMAADKSWTDEFYYGAHDATQTVGRYPDGAADIYTMSVPTISKTNIMSTYAEKTDQEELKHATGIRPTMASAANGFRIRYGSQQLLLKGEDDVEQVLVEVFTTDGRMVSRQPVTLSHGAARVDVSSLPQGFYVARATADQATRVSCKFMK